MQDCIPYSLDEQKILAEIFHTWKVSVPSPEAGTAFAIHMKRIEEISADPKIPEDIKKILHGYTTRLRDVLPVIAYLQQHIIQDLNAAVLQHKVDNRTDMTSVHDVLKQLGNP